MVIRHVPESAAQRLLIEKGDIDVARLLNSDDLKALEGRKDIRIEKTAMHGYIHLMFNTTDPAFADPRVRMAFRYLVDYDGLGKTVMAYQGVPRASVVPIGAFGALDEKEGQPFTLDIAKAQALLKEAGQTDLKRKMLVMSVTPYPDLAQHVQANAAKAGITLELEQMAPAQVFTKARAREYQMMLINWGVRSPDPHNMVSRHVMNPDNRPEAKLAQYPSWRAAWQDQAMNELGLKAMMERDLDRKRALYREIQLKNMQEGPMAYMFQVVRPMAIRSEVQGFEMSAFKVGYETASSSGAAAIAAPRRMLHDPLELGAGVAEGGEDRRVELGGRGASVTLQDDAAGCLVIERRAVGTLFAKCVIDIAHGDETALDRNCLSRQAVGIARPVKAFVMEQGNRRRRIQHRVAGGAQEVMADDRVLLHDLPLGCVERTRLAQDQIGDCDLADIVESCSMADQPHMLCRQAERGSDDPRHLADPGDVPGEAGIAGFRQPGHAAEKIRSPGPGHRRNRRRSVAPGA